MMCCYIGKATKIFIFIVTLLVVTGLVLGLHGFIRKHLNHKDADNTSCSADSCDLTANPNSQINPISAFPNPNSGSVPPNNGPSSAAQPPPPPGSLNPSLNNPNLTPPSPQLQASTPPPPQSQSVSARPPSLSPPGAALVASGPVHS
ncbi:unnamed protein product [Cuscuta epithymum]|uniref:Uncharacterized protein n=1 Tax=Cuscuta epithymum TaxID=186058 RepID=A0AAV0CCA9_9ASTE|nr:unnamed protein product [Cuscuta epithymum]